MQADAGADVTVDVLYGITLDTTTSVSLSLEGDGKLQLLYFSLKGDGTGVTATIRNTDLGAPATGTLHLLAKAA